MTQALGALLPGARPTLLDLLTRYVGLVADGSVSAKNIAIETVDASRDDLVRYVRENYPDHAELAEFANALFDVYRFWTSLRS